MANVIQMQPLVIVVAPKSSGRELPRRTIARLRSVQTDMAPVRYSDMLGMSRDFFGPGLVFFRMKPENA